MNQFTADVSVKVMEKLAMDLPDALYSYLTPPGWASLLADRNAKNETEMPDSIAKKEVLRSSLMPAALGSSLGSIPGSAISLAGSSLLAPEITLAGMGLALLGGVTGGMAGSYLGTKHYRDKYNREAEELRDRRRSR